MTTWYSLWWVSLLFFIPYAILLSIGHELYRRFVIGHTFVIILLFCCITPFYFYPIGITETWVILKYFLITICLLLILFMRIQKFKQVELRSDFQRLMWKLSVSSCCYSERTLFIVVYILLILSMFDSILIEYLSHYYFNSLCGILLCITIPIPKKLAYPVQEWIIEPQSSFYALSVRLRCSWVLIYTSWNLCFIYTIFPTQLIKQGFLVFVPLITALVDVKKFNIWLSARIYTQSMFYFAYLVICVYRFSSDYIMTSNIDEILEENVLHKIDDHINNRLFVTVWAVFNFIVGAFYTMWWFQWVYKQNKRKYRVLQTTDMDDEYGILYTDKDFCIDDDEEDDEDVDEDNVSHDVKAENILQNNNKGILGAQI